MTLEGVKDMHPFISLPACAGATFQLDMLKDCYLLYLRDREYPCWPRASRRRRIIRNKWNAPELEASYFPRLCRNSTDRPLCQHDAYSAGRNTACLDYPPPTQEPRKEPAGIQKKTAPPFFSGRRSAAIPPSAAPFVKQALKHPRFFQKIFEKPPGCYRISMQSP